MAQSVKHEDLSLDPEHPCEELVPIISALGNRDRKETGEFQELTGQPVQQGSARDCPSRLQFLLDNSPELREFHLGVFPDQTGQ